MAGLWKGNNLLELNEATLILAVQYWLRAETVAPALSVTSIGQDKTNTGAKVFRVAVMAEEPVSK